MLNIDTSNTPHTVTLSAAQIDVIVDAMLDRAELLRSDGTPTPELCELVDMLDACINSDLK